MRILRYISHKANSIRQKTLLSLAIRAAPDAFATHLPFLLATANMTSARHILELGSGKFSTLALNDSTLFPDVESVRTMEDDPIWAGVVQSLPLQPGRSVFESVPSIRDRLLEMDLSPFDLIFVDNDTEVSERAATLNVVLRRARPDAIIIVHDFEWRSYRAEVTDRWQAYTFHVWKPFTGIIWQNDKLAIRSLKAVERQIYMNRGISPARGDFWSKLLIGFRKFRA